MAPAISTNIVGTTIDRRYKILLHTGTGRHSSVFVAEDLERQYTVALKFLNEEFFPSKNFEQYRLSAEKAKALVHPNITRLFSCECSADGNLYLVTDHVQGIDLTNLLRRKKRLSLSSAISLMAQVCDALEHAHSKDVIHGHLTPNNVMLIEESDRVKVTDFGLAPPRQPGKAKDSSLGTGTESDETSYLSPEQLAGHKSDARADLYSAGCLLFQCLTGSAPPAQVAKSDPSLFQLAHIQDAAKRAQIEAVLTRALAVKPKERYQRASDFSFDLTLITDGTGNDWETKAHAMRPVVPIRSNNVLMLLKDLRLPVAIAAGLIAIPLGALITISVLDIDVPVLMPYEIAIQEKVFEPRDPRLVKNLEYMITYYKGQRKYAEAGGYATKLVRATSSPTGEGIETLNQPNLVE